MVVDQRAAEPSEEEGRGIGRAEDVCKGKEGNGGRPAGDGEAHPPTLDEDSTPQPPAHHRAQEPSRRALAVEEVDEGGRLREQLAVVEEDVDQVPHQEGGPEDPRERGVQRGLRHPSDAGALLRQRDGEPEPDDAADGPRADPEHRAWWGVDARQHSRAA